MKKSVIHLYDDLTGKPGDDITTVYFSYNGFDYEIDLGEKGKQKFDAAMKLFIENGRRTLQTKSRKGAKRNDTYPYSRELQKEVRAWAAKKGVSLPDRGRIRRELVAEYLNGSKSKK